MSLTRSERQKVRLIHWRRPIGGARFGTVAIHEARVNPEVPEIFGQVKFLAPTEEGFLSENEFLKKPWRTLSATIGDRDEPGETWIWDDFAWLWS
jgi:hypothetical protein